jgi:hypothetical protein
MKSIKNIIAAFLMVGVLSVSSAFADGIIVGDRSDGIIVGDKACTATNDGIIVGDKAGIIVGDIASVVGGIIVGDFYGILIVDGSTSSCGTQAKDGIIVGD